MARRKSIKDIIRDIRKTGVIHKEDLERRFREAGYDEFLYPELQDEIFQKTVQSEKDILKSPFYSKHIAQTPLDIERKKKLGLPYTEEISQFTPEQREINKRINEYILQSGGLEKILEQVSQPDPFQEDLSKMLGSLISEHQEGGTPLDKFVERTSQPGLFSGEYEGDIMSGIQQIPQSALGLLQNLLGAGRSGIQGLGNLLSGLRSNQQSDGIL